MSLGGYMFEGRFCQKGSLTDVQWYHLLHATRVAAFMAANTRANAGWEYDMTGSSDGNIHCLDAVGNNYVTCFKNTAKGTYFALYTLCKATGTGTDSGSVQVTQIYGAIPSSSTSYYIGSNCCCFYSLSKSHIAYDTKPGSADTGKDLFPVGNTGCTLSGLGSGYTTVSNTIAGRTKCYFGFAIKGDDIVMLQDDTSVDVSYLCTSIASGSAFSSFVNANDTKGMFCLNTQYSNSTAASDYEYGGRNVTSNALTMQLCNVETYTGSKIRSASLGFTPLTYYSGNMQEYPFESIYVFNVPNSESNVYGKGTLKVDLMSVNLQNRSNHVVPTVYSTVAGGNYLTVRNITDSSFGYIFNRVNASSDLTVHVAIYCGWDASNPDITQESAWTEYTES